MKSNTENLPGTLWKSNGAWHWRVKLPGHASRSDTVLTMPFSGARIPDTADRDLAESAAWRLWAKYAKTSSDGRPVFTLNDLVERWAAHSAEYYGGNEDASVMCGLRSFQQLYGTRPVESLTHGDMLRYRDSMLASGSLARSTINKRLGYVKRMVSWALDELLVSAQTKAELTQISNLKRGRTKARETEPVRAVPDADVEKAVAFMPPSLADMVRVHRLTGMRPDEMCGLNWGEIEKGAEVWVYRPGHHKNEWRGQPRAVAIGPRAQAILSKYEGNEPFVFSPALTMRERYEEKRARRKTKVQPSQIDRSCADSMRRPGERWTVCAYARAVKYACRRAGVDWCPLQLRHSCATEARRRFGIMAAHAILGHSMGPKITDVYSFETAADEMVRASTPAILSLG